MQAIKTPIFYIYAYLDPLKPGEYVYGAYRFNHEPFYIGKGCRSRCKVFMNGRSKFVKNKVSKILKHGRKPVVIKIHKNILENEAYALEERLIGVIGRRDKQEGPLVNLSDGGDGSSAGRIVSEEEREFRRQVAKREWNDPNSKFNSNECRKKQIASNKKAWADPASGFNSEHRRLKIIAAVKRASRNPDSYVNSTECKEKHSRGLRRAWKKEGSTLVSCGPKRVEGIKKAWANPEVRKKSSTAHKKRWADPNSAYNSESCREKMALVHAQRWFVVPPNESPFEILNLRKFCRENNLDAAAMHRVANGKANKHKGWRCRRAA